MKYGFYLSPCGEHIVELRCDDAWSHRTIVIARSDGVWVDYLATISNEDLPVFFSCWIYLGE